VIACGVMSHPTFDPALALDYLEGRRSPKPLMSEATRLRDEGKGRTVTYSRKAFIPLTTLCRDRCTYCTFAKPPGAGGEFMTLDEVLSLARAGERYGCTEALLTLGDQPEERWPAARAFLEDQGMASTIEYVRAAAQVIVERTSLFPHANPGVMTRNQILALRPTNVSMGLMLENISDRLTEPGMPHFGSPDKVPAARVDTIASAGESRVPFTSGILVGIGENSSEIVDSLLALDALQSRYGHLQEIIVQNFRSKADTPMRNRGEPTQEYVAIVVAVARWLFGPTMNIQVPPNLTDEFEQYLDAGVNDWGGVSPLTIDWVNPERPWPHLDDLRARTEAAGFGLRARMPVYPEFIDAAWIDERLLGRLAESIDGTGLVAA
jgi:FO synthase